uniref:Uncharacterized protein n=1 Tax=Siphoviridae sp. ctNHg2 TaxID=2825467 RepID=A0A8S5V4J2_9CAUD|nr:MAG TPA: hypothetical protein [Siphoviridae sp. ctNHg2]
MSKASKSLTIIAQRQVRVQVSWFFPSTELIVSWTFPNLYPAEVIKQRLKRSRQTEFPIWSIPIATERKIPPKYQSPFLLAELVPGTKNLNQISINVRSSPSGSNTTARARATIRSMRLCRSFFIFWFFSK